MIKCATTGGASSRPGRTASKDIAFTKDEIHAVSGRIARPGPACHVPRSRWTRPAHALSRPGWTRSSTAVIPNEDPELIPMMAERGTFFRSDFTLYALPPRSQCPHACVPAAVYLYPHHIAACKGAAARVVKLWPAPMPVGTMTTLTLGCSSIWSSRPIPHAGLASRHRVGRGVPGTGGRSRYGDAWEARRPRGGGWQPLKNITVMQDVQRIKLVLKGGDICVDRRVDVTRALHSRGDQPISPIQPASQAIRIVAQYTAYAI